MTKGFIVTIVKQQGSYQLKTQAEMSIYRDAKG